MADQRVPQSEIKQLTPGYFQLTLNTVPFSGERFCLGHNVLTISFRLDAPMLC